MHLVAVVGCTKEGHKPAIMLHLVPLILHLYQTETWCESWWGWGGDGGGKGRCDNKYGTHAGWYNVNGVDGVGG